MLIRKNYGIDIIGMQAELLMQVLQQSATKSMSPAELASNLKQLGGVLTHLLEIHREKLPEWASADQLPKVCF